MRPNPLNLIRFAPAEGRDELVASFPLIAAIRTSNVEMDDGRRQCAHRAYRYDRADPRQPEGLCRPAQGGDARDRSRAVVRRASPARLRHLRSLRSEEHTSELQSLMRISYAVFCLKKKKHKHKTIIKTNTQQ